MWAPSRRRPDRTRTPCPGTRQAAFPEHGLGLRPRGACTTQCRGLPSPPRGPVLTPWHLGWLCSGQCRQLTVGLGRAAGGNGVRPSWPWGCRGLRALRWEADVLVSLSRGGFSPASSSQGLSIGVGPFLLTDPPRPAPGPQSISLSGFGQPESVGALGSELGPRLACRGCGDPTGLPTAARELRVAEAPGMRLRIVLTSHRKGRPGGSAEAALAGVLHAAETHGDSRLRGQSRTPCELAPCRGQPSPSQLLSPREEGRPWSVQVPERGIVRGPGPPPIPAPADAAVIAVGLTPSPGHPGCALHSGPGPGRAGFLQLGRHAPRYGSSRGWGGGRGCVASLSL